VETVFPGYDPTKPHTIRLESRYNASFAGDGTYLPSSDTGNLIK
jgi:hypothetical protein